MAKPPKIEQGNIFTGMHEIWTVHNGEGEEVAQEYREGWGNEQPESIEAAYLNMRPPMAELGTIEIHQNTVETIAGSEFGINMQYDIMFAPTFGDAYAIGTIQYTMCAEHKEGA